MKKEYYLPLAIIIGTIIIGFSIYLGSTAEYRAKKAYCEFFVKEMTPKNTRKDSLFYQMQITKCLKTQ